MKSQARVRGLSFAAALALATAAAGCAAKVEEKPRPAEAPAALAKERECFGGPAGMVLGMVEQHASPTAEQRATLAAIRSELELDPETRRALHDKLKTSAITVLRSGTAKSGDFERSVDLAVGAIEERIGRASDALEEIHAILTPEQRQAVAAALSVKIEEKHGRLRAGERDARQRDGFRRVASHLMLSSLQIDKLVAIKQELVGKKEELRPSREELLALVAAFESEDFASALQELREKKSRILRERVKSASERTDSVLSVFTQEQRELLADLILEGPEKVLFGEDRARVE